MTVNIPSENPNIPENLKKIIEKTRNNISVQEAEAKRLKGLVSGLNTQVATTHAAKVAGEEEVAELTARKEELAITVTQAVNDVTKKREEIKEMSVLLATYEEDKKAFDNDRKEFIAFSAKSKDELDKWSDLLQKREDDLQLKEADVDSKAKKLKELSAIL